MSDLSGYTLAAVGAATASAVAMGAYVFGSSGYEPVNFPLGLDQQSVEIEKGVRVSPLVKDGKLVEYFYEDAKTLYDGFKRGLKVSNNGPCLGARTGPNKEYSWIRYQEVYDRAQKVGSALIDIGLKSGPETIVGIFSPNRAEWIISEQALNMYSMVLVPLYDTLGSEACSYIINQTSMTTVLCDKSEKAMTLMQGAVNTPTLKNVIIFEAPSEELVKSAKEHNIALHLFADVEKKGSENIKEPVPPKPDDLATICYTSGTTGNPKGVMLSHKNIMADTGAVLALAQGCFEIDCNDIHISYLPLAHMFERIVQAMMFQHGGQIGFFGGDVRTLLDDMKVLRPTIFPTVPRLLNRVYDKVLLGIRGSTVKKMLFNLAVSQKMSLLKKGIITKESIWDRLVFGKIQAMMGGRVKFVVTGSAPLAGNVLNFTRCAFGCMVFEGYGQTESTAGVTFTFPTEHAVGHVGAPLPCNFVKVVDVPEMDYYAKDNRGEVCVKGANCMTGYYKDPQKTAETIDEEGWIHTGDVGMWLPNGSLKIIDRKKNIFKLAQGEYLAPEKIEGVYLRSSMVAQVFVDGDSLQTFAVAVVIPDPEVIPRWASSKGISGTMEEMCNNETVKKAIHDDLIKIGKEAKLKGFEQAKDIFLHPELFSVENGLLTPTFKSKRPELRKFFKEQIIEMYRKAAS